MVLIILALAMYPLGMILEDRYPSQNPEEIAAFKIGDTVLSGMDVVDDGKIRSVPILYHPEYLVDHIKDRKFFDFIHFLMTGTVKTPIVRITGGSISRYGIAQGFKGPGILVNEGEKLVVRPPDDFVWGFKTSYVVGVKTKDGLQIKKEKTTLDFVPYDEINNDTIPHKYVKIESLKEWYKEADVGDYITLDYAIGNFNDDRNLVTPDKIKSFFGEKVEDYLKDYPIGAPVLVWSAPYVQREVGSSTSVLESFPEYNDYNRAYNAQQFAKAWNGTIIPPHTASCGKETVSFTSSYDPNATGGWASHGTCPPARALRDAGSEAGLPLPTGMSWAYFCLMYGYDPTMDVFVQNTRDYPIKIIMWTEGSGPSMVIYAKIIELVPVGSKTANHS